MIPFFYRKGVGGMKRHFQVHVERGIKLKWVWSDVARTLEN